MADTPTESAGASYPAAAAEGDLVSRDPAADANATPASTAVPAAPATDAAQEIQAPACSDGSACPASSAASSLSEKVRESLLRQVEYYFSDLSFPYDEFLQAAADDTHAVPVQVVAGSPRIVSMLPDMTLGQRAEAITCVLPESDSVQLSPQGRVSRLHPLPSEDPKAQCSVYLSGTAKGADEAEVRQMLVETGSANSFSPVVSVRRLRDLQRDRSFTGQVFVELESAEKAAALVKAANKGSIKCSKGKLLKDFFESQDRSIREQREKRASRKGGGGGPAAQAASGHGDGQHKRPLASAPAEASERGLVLRFEGPGPMADREAVQEVCKQFGDVAYVSFSRGDAEGSVRFKEKGSAEAALAALTSSPADLGGSKANWRRLTEEEEDRYFQEYRERAHQKRRRGGGGYGGRGRGRVGR